MHKILIANRGEIAVRVIRTAREMGYRTVAVYSDADERALHVQNADEAVHVGASPASASYLNIDAIIDAAKKTNADAIHPGYGFLSENAAFADACAANDITFIGPPADAITLMGSKRLSKIAMQEAGVPCVPGYDGNAQDNETLMAETEAIGFPLMIKASAGGGGKGMRLVHSKEDLEAGLTAARTEAQNAFGSDELILEKALVGVRHIEIQVFADQAGNTVHLFERDCSVQRRHQKVVEEAPSPYVDDELRAKMGQAAVNAAKACNYVGAGTVEFLVDADRNFYFLEMNTRLQVEHPVTEMITGQDLVEWQLRVADGERLPLMQDEIQMQGHAIEVRLYAEDPRQNFIPQTGLVRDLNIPDRPGLRFDCGMQNGDQVGVYYDPMLAKVIAYGRSRSEASRRLSSGLKDLHCLGLNHNKHFLNAILENPVFSQGDATTRFIEDHMSGNDCLTVDGITGFDLALAALVFRRPTDKPVMSPQSSVTDLAISILDLAHKVRVETVGDAYSFTVQDEEIKLRLLWGTENCIHYVHEGVQRSLTYVVSGDTVFFEGKNGHIAAVNQTYAPASKGGSASDGVVKAPMDGAVLSVIVQEGDYVAAGRPLVVMEAMKMEHTLTSPIDGIVDTVSVSVGDQVKSKAALCLVVPKDD